jgi:NADPH-dependent F420 reductase
VGSAAEQAAALLPQSKVIAAFHTVAAATLQDPDGRIDEDVLITGDDAEAKAVVKSLVEGIVGARAVDAGPLRYSRFVEGITVLLIGINGRYKAHAGVRVVGLPS